MPGKSLNLIDTLKILTDRFYFFTDFRLVTLALMLNIVNTEYVDHITILAYILVCVQWYAEYFQCYHAYDRKQHKPAEYISSTHHY